MFGVHWLLEKTSGAKAPDISLATFGPTKVVP
jgi:hypothetical protein